MPSDNSRIFPPYRVEDNGRATNNVTAYFRIEHFPASLNRVGAGSITTIFSDLERAKAYKRALIESGRHSESDIIISTTDSEGRAVTA